jgi:hypothetical protein
MNDPAFEQRARGEAVATGENGSLAEGRPLLGIRCNRVIARHKAVDFALAYCDRC